jgi:hypothetical protein
MRKQALGGDILNIVSKTHWCQDPTMQVMVQQKQRVTLSRLNAAELGPDRIRVEWLIPTVISDSKIWEGMGRGTCKSLRNNQVNCQPIMQNAPC